MTKGRIAPDRKSNPSSREQLKNRLHKSQSLDYKSSMNIRPRYVLLLAPVALASMNWLSPDVMALDFSQARVTQVIQDVKVLPSGAAARPAAVNETVQKGSAVQTGLKSRSELTFQDQTITRLGEKTI